MREFLESVDVFRGLSVSTLESVAAAVEPLSLPLDAYLFREGDPADAMFVVRAGAVRVIRQRPQGGIIVARLGAGAVIGERGVLGGERRAASVITDAPSVFLKLQRIHFERLAEHEPLLRSRIQDTLGARQSGPSPARLIPEGDAGVRLVGHRDYVGGRWDVIGLLQFDFLVVHGLAPSHCLLDIACGALRGGVHFIRYLDRAHYLGLDKEKTLVDLGIEKELGADLYADKCPEFVISERFAFHRFSKKPHFSIAQSLFTHLTPDDTRLCLRNLRDFVDTGHVLFATFFEGDSGHNPAGSHSQKVFRYSRAEMERFGQEVSWQTTYLGDWNHPLNQMMMRFDAS